MSKRLLCNISGLAGITLIAATTSCVRYEPQPLDPPALEHAHRSRALTDPALRAFVAERYSGTLAKWPPRSLDLEMATLVGWFFHPDLRVAQAAVNTAQANVISAGARINPSLTVSSGYNTAPESRGLLDFLPSFKVETAGKRGKRILLAKEQLAVARLRVEETAWRIRSRIRSASSNWIAASRDRSLLEEEVETDSEVVAMLRLRLRVGEAAKPHVDRAEQQLFAARAALADADGRQASARAGLATALGLPVDALSNIRIAAEAFEAPPPVDELPLRGVQRAGLLNRSDIRRALAEYAAAEAAVRLEVARQYPNVQLDPGVIFEEGFLRYVFGFTLAPPLLNRNQGPIAVAEAQRAEVEERFKQLQKAAMGEMEQALSAYAGARGELAAAKRRVDAARRVEEAAQKSFSAGETDRLALAGDRLLRLAAEQGQRKTLTRAQTVFGRLEDSVQQPLTNDLRPFGESTPQARFPTP